MMDPKLPCGMEESRLQEYLDGALPGEERQRFEAHLDGCGNCSAELEAFRGLYARLAFLPLFSPGAEFDHAVLSAVLPGRRRVFGLPPMAWFATSYVVFTSGLAWVAMVLSGVVQVGGKVSPLAQFWHAALDAGFAVLDRARGVWDLLHAIFGPLGVLAGLGQVGARLVFAVVSTPDGRFYLALSAFTALAFLLLARRPQKGGSLVTSAI